MVEPVQNWVVSMISDRRKPDDRRESCSDELIGTALSGSFFQWLFLVPLKGARDYITPQVRQGL